MLPEDELLSAEDSVPRHLQSLFILRISLCILAAGLALLKVMLSPPLAGFFLDVFADLGPGLAAWLSATNLVVSGLLAVALALVVATFLMQARLRGQEAQSLLDIGGTVS